jgi:hypothetical protein
MKDKPLDKLRDTILEIAYNQAVNEYGRWEKYEMEQWQALHFYGEDDLLDLALALLSGARRWKYPIPALDLCALTLRKFNLDGRIGITPVVGGVPNTRTGDMDPVQWFPLQVREGVQSTTRLHFGGHLLARCAILTDNPQKYLVNLHVSIGSFARREFYKLTTANCPYENEAKSLNQLREGALEKVRSYLYLD